MVVSVIIEPIDGKRFRAIGASGMSVGLTAEGETADEALEKVAQQVKQRLDAGAKLVDLDLPATEAPWKGSAGWLKDCPLYDDWRSEMEARRREIDAEQNAQ